MNKNFQTVFNFSILRIVKNKLFIVTTTLVLSLVFFINILVMGLVGDIAFGVQISIMFTVIFSIFWISLVNITNVVMIAVLDSKSGIQGLENRRGVSNSKIFFAKFLPLKIVTFSYITAVILIFFFLASVMPISARSFIISNLAIGLFSLFAYDIFIFGIVVLLASATKSLKRTLPAGWVITTLFLFFSIFGPIFFAFSPGDYYEDQYSITSVNQRNLMLVQSQGNKFFSSQSQSFSDLYDIFHESIKYDKLDENDYNREAQDMINSVINLSLYEGYLPWIGEIIEAGKFTEETNWYLKHFNKSLDDYHIKIDEEKISYELSQNNYYQFIKEINIKASGNQVTNFKNSYYHSANSKNYSGKQQLKEVINNLKDYSNQGVISEAEKNALVKAIEDEYFIEIAPFSNAQIYPEYQGRPDRRGWFKNSAIWAEKSTYSFGSYLFNKIYRNLVGPISYFEEKNEEIIAKGEKSDFKFDGALNYQINPFMWFYEMVYFSGPYNIANDSNVINTSPLPISEFTKMAIDSKGELIYSQRPFCVWANYLGFIGIGTLLAGLGYRSFCKTKDERKLVD